MKIILSSNPYRDRGLRAALQANKILQQQGARTVLCLPFTPKKGDRLDLPNNIVLGDLHEELKTADVIVCFGGDGTILHAARDATQYNVPVLGVNMGNVGFMAEVERSELGILANLMKKPLVLEERMMLCVRHMWGDRLITEDYALNDALLSKSSTARVVELEIWAGNTLITQLTGDGVIVATPTGSTAYSMSAGGPIVEPTSSGIIVTPVCAHQLGARPMVLDSKRVVTLRNVRGSRKILSLAIDGGKAIRINGDERVEISRANRVTQLVRLTDRNFYQIINQKLGGFGK